MDEMDEMDEIPRFCCSTSEKSPSFHIFSGESLAFRRSYPSDEVMQSTKHSASTPKKMTGGVRSPAVFWASQCHFWERTMMMLA